METRGTCGGGTECTGSIGPRAQVLATGGEQGERETRTGGGEGLYEGRASRGEREETGERVQSGTTARPPSLPRSPPCTPAGR